MDQWTNRARYGLRTAFEVIGLLVLVLLDWFVTGVLILALVLALYRMAQWFFTW